MFNAHQTTDRRGSLCDSLKSIDFYLDPIAELKIALNSPEAAV
jgi:hypothetical protein